MKNFWQTLPKPLFTLAPLADVTDAAFRRLIAKYSGHVRKDGSIGGPDIMFTEFVSADGLVRATEEGKRKLMADLLYSEKERPIVAQLFSAEPEHMEQAVRLCKELGFDGVDINMGCPDRSVEKQGCGAAMIKNPKRAQEIIQAAKRGADGLPVSVKTRIGYNKNELATWLPALIDAEPAAVTIHARTRKEMSKVPAKWDHVKEAVAIRDGLKSEALIIGNGDVLDHDDALEKIEMTGADGVMFGRAIFGNPWLFHPTKCLPERIPSLASLPLAHQSNQSDSLRASSFPRSSSQAEILPDKKYNIVTIPERLRVMVEHTKLFEELLSHKNFAIMKKHHKAYVNGFLGAKELRTELMEADSAGEVEAIVNSFIQRTVR
jgi:tRNA-dihydrouridine synthase